MVTYRDKVFHNLHMMWICICRCHNHVTAALVGQEAFKIFPGFLVTLREGSKPELTAVIEAIDPLKWAPISISNIYEVFHNLHMLWMFICTCLYHVTATLLCQAFGISQGFWLPHGGQPKVHCSDWGYRPILQTHITSFTTFIWCGCSYISVLIMLPLMLLLAKLGGT